MTKKGCHEEIVEIDSRGLPKNEVAKNDADRQRKSIRGFLMQNCQFLSASDMRNSETAKSLIDLFYTLRLIT